MGCGSSKENNDSQYRGPRDVKIVMLGNGGVGKSACTYRFVHEKFNEAYNPTIEDSYRKAIKLDGRNYVLDILDTAGQEEYTELREVYMRGGEGFIVVYSVTDHKSFQEISEFRDRTLRVKDKKEVPMILVGNQADLENQRKVTKEEGQQLAAKFGVPFYEASALTGHNCEEIFYAMCREITNNSKYANQ